MNKFLLLFIFPCWISVSHAQSFAINTDGSAAHNSALLDVKSTAKGMLVPRMTKAQRDAIAAPANGLMVYVNAPDTTGFSFYDGTAWKWMEEKGNGWMLSGNIGTNPLTHYIGTNDTSDLSFRVNGFERMRLTNKSALGIQLNDPKYTVDIATDGSAFTQCDSWGFNGLRVRRAATAGLDCNQGFVFGHSYAFNEDNNLYIWNYGQVSGPSKNIVLGFNQRNGLPLTEAFRITDNRHAGIDEPDPKYNLDIYTGGTGFNTCNDRLGLRINTPLTGGRDCSKGLFLGYNIDGSGTSKKVSLWNFTPNAVSTDQYIRFGFGPDFTDLPFPGFGEAMRILPPGQGVSIGTRNTPLAMLHISNNTGGGAPMGLMVTSPNLAALQNGFFVGLGGPQIITGNEAKIWNYQNSDITFGTNDIARLTIKANGNLFFGAEFSGTPTDKAFFFVDTVQMNKDLRVFGHAKTAKIITDDIQIIGGPTSAGKVLTSDAAGNGSWADLPGFNNHWTANGDHIYNNNIAYVGIGNPNPVSPLSFPSVTGDKISLWGNTIFNSYGLGIQSSLLQIYAATAADDIAFGYGGSASFTEQMRIKGNGNVGIGVDPLYRLDVGARMRIRSAGDGNQNNSAGIWLNNATNSATSPAFIGMKLDNEVGIYGQTGTPNWRFYINTTTGDGWMQGTLTQASDIRLKKNIQPLNNALSKIAQLNGYTYNWKDNNNTDEQIGLLAQEIQKVYPQLVKEGNNGTLSVNYSGMIPVLLQAIKEQQQQIDELKRLVQQRPNK